MGMGIEGARSVARLVLLDSWGGNAAYQAVRRLRRGWAVLRDRGKSRERVCDARRVLRSMLVRSLDVGEDGKQRNQDR